MERTPSVLCFAAFPAVQRTLELESFAVGHVNRVGAVTMSAAGKAVNAGRAVHLLGGHAIVTGFSGGETGRFVESYLQREGISFAFVPTASSTRCCHTLIDRAAGTTTEIVEEAEPPQPGEWVSLERHFGVLLPQAHVAILMGTLPAGAPADLYLKLLRRAAERRTRVIVDTQREPLRQSLAGHPFLVKPNRLELARTLGATLDSAEAIVQAARDICRHGAGHALVTDGAQPAWLVNLQHAWRIQPPAVTPRNTTGSGDALAGALAFALAEGRALTDAVRFAVASGAASCLTDLPGVVDPETVRQLLPSVAISDV
jgi:1-phosphofructokinase family hexose kinase